MSEGTSANAEQEEFITILGLGSLLSERSSRMTFPDLQNFRLGRVPNYRRVFGHPASIFFQRGIANQETLEMSSLSAEYVDGHAGFVCTIFEVPNNNMMEGGMPSKAYLEREEEFDIISVPYIDLENGKERQGGVLCARYTDEGYTQRWGKERFEKQYGVYGIATIWGWKQDSGLLPCATYLRHCTLAAKSMGPACSDSFLDETFLADRTTTIRTYLASNPQIMTTEPPPELAVRYGG
eukprot:CAMPEP_0119022660 /NCGR_PEP_ID=MMETSP1176-20130426/28498_1 /TAXON_ID=265551 /ORGANISM="Synedropsis recta cf, Strain CCMP1620" /LENGTH=237 /DNA_ID=CAMNT_0006977579 /DNA_START=45 /DNA_END=754 /DNA_ORIENTATION=-